MNIQKIVGMNLKYLRFKSKQRQEEFYSKLKLNVKYMANIERGTVIFKALSLNKIAKALSIDVQELLVYNENRIITKKKNRSKKRIMFIRFYF